MPPYRALCGPMGPYGPNRATKCRVYKNDHVNPWLPYGAIMGHKRPYRAVLAVWGSTGPYVVILGHTVSFVQKKS